LQLINRKETAAVWTKNPAQALLAAAESAGAAAAKGRRSQVGNGAGMQTRIMRRSAANEAGSMQEHRVRGAAWEEERRAKRK
jgi:hypothetical protein